MTTEKQDEGKRAKARSPYRGNPPHTFWATGVSGREPEDLEEFYRRKFIISSDDRIVTAGSCFAQHIARHLRANGYCVVDTEPAPTAMARDAARRYGFGIYSARFGNLYYVRQLVQLTREALGGQTPDDVVWEKRGRYFDALRPSVEPEGHSTPALVLQHRRQHLLRVREMLVTADVFVYTFGLTEGWVHKGAGTVYPTAPGTIAGDFDPDIYEFRNFTYPEIWSDFVDFRDLIQSVNPSVKFLVTVSPVGLAATASGDHVLTATTYSKAVLRAVAGDLATEFSDVDYFPSYELITSSLSRGRFYDESLRDVDPEGVSEVMKYFFQEHPPCTSGDTELAKHEPDHEQVMCEEVLLEAFGQ